MPKNSALTHEEIVELGKTIFDQVTGYIANLDGWNFSEETHGVKMYKRQVSKVPGVHEKGCLVMGVGFVPHATREEFMELVLDAVMRKEWDTCDFYDVVTSIDATTDVCHVGVPSLGPVSARDFVSVRRSLVDSSDNSYTAAQVSIEYPLTGREHLIKKHVRGTLLPSCWRFVEKEGGCDAYYISGVQLGGWLPQALVDSFVYSNTHGTFFQNIRKIFLKRYESKDDGEAEADGVKKKDSKRRSKKHKKDTEAEANGEPSEEENEKEEENENKAYEPTMEEEACED